MRNSTGRAGTDLSRVCVSCGTPFVTDSSHPRKMYCSRNCYLAHQASLRRAKCLERLAQRRCRCGELVPVTFDSRNRPVHRSLCDTCRAVGRRDSANLVPEGWLRCADCGAPNAWQGNLVQVGPDGLCHACRRWAERSMQRRRSRQTTVPAPASDSTRVLLEWSRAGALLAEIAAAHGYSVAELRDSTHRDTDVVRARYDAVAIFWIASQATITEIATLLGRHHTSILAALWRVGRAGVSSAGQPILARYLPQRPLPYSMPPKQPVTGMVTVSVVASRLGLTPDDVRKRIRRGLIRAEKRHDHLWIPAAELERLLKEKEERGA